MEEVDFAKMTDDERKNFKIAELRRYFEPRMDVPNTRGVVKALVLKDTVMLEKIQKRYNLLNTLLSDVESKIISAKNSEEENKILSEIDKKKIEEIDISIFGSPIKQIKF